MLATIITAALATTIASAQTCTTPLVLNDFNRDALGDVVSYSTIGEMYGDDGSITQNGGRFEIDNGQLHIVAPSNSPSYWFMEFEPHCMVPQGTVTSSNGAYTSFSGFSAIAMDVQASPGAQISIQLSGGNPAECDATQWRYSAIMLPVSSAEMQSVTIPLDDWRTGSFDPNLGLHSISFTFVAGAGDFRFDNIRLCGAGSEPSTVSPLPKATMVPSTTAPGVTKTAAPTPIGDKNELETSDVDTTGATLTSLLILGAFIAVI